MAGAADGARPMPRPAPAPWAVLPDLPPAGRRARGDVVEFMPNKKQKRGWKFPPLVGAPVAMRTLHTQAPERTNGQPLLPLGPKCPRHPAYIVNRWRAALIS
ncbi:MAG: hypothetical protein EBV28_02790 [Betaproteobacteria bacterium]|nr:hypothetical protein [Betaproteobacteria bacterium]